MAFLWTWSRSNQSSNCLLILKQTKTFLLQPGDKNCNSSTNICGAPRNSNSYPLNALAIRVWFSISAWFRCFSLSASSWQFFFFCSNFKKIKKTQQVRTKRERFNFFTPEFTSSLSILPLFRELVDTKWKKNLQKFHRKKFKKIKIRQNYKRRFENFVAFLNLILPTFFWLKNEFTFPKSSKKVN
jgi:hypothetical protein